MPLSLAAAPRVRSSMPASVTGSQSAARQRRAGAERDDHAAAAFHEGLQPRGDRVAERQVLEDHDAGPRQRFGRDRVHAVRRHLKARPIAD